MTTRNDLPALLSELLELVKDDFRSLGWADRAEDTRSLIGAGEYELAYTNLCSNIHEFDIPISLEAYALFVKIWPVIGRDVQSLEGADWHYLDYLGTRPGFPAEKGELAPHELKRPGETVEQQGKREYIWDAAPFGVVKPGHFERHANWKLTDPLRIAFDRLTRLGVTIYSVADGTDFTFEVPHGLFNEQYTEVEQLTQAVAQAVHSEVQYIDWYPHGHKLRIYITPREK